MAESLDVKKGDKVARIDWARGIADIVTVVSVSKKGAVTVENSVGHRGMYAQNGYGKGESVGRIRELEEGEEEKFLEDKKREWAEIANRRKEKDAQRAERVEKSRKWIQKYAWDVNSIQTVNCTLYIVSLPIPNEPCTLVMRFDRNASQYTANYEYSVSISIHDTRGGYLSSGSTSMNSKEIVPLEIAAEWMASWADLEKLEVS